MLNRRVGAVVMFLFVILFAVAENAHAGIFDFIYELESTPKRANWLARVYSWALRPQRRRVAQEMIDNLAA